MVLARVPAAVVGPNGMVRKVRRRWWALSHSCQDRALLRVKILLLTNGGILDRVDDVVYVAVQLLLVQLNLGTSQLASVHGG